MVESNHHAEDATFDEEGAEGYGDVRIGFPVSKPTVSPYSHGWCFKPQKFGLAQVCTKDTMCVVELGSYLGNSAKAIAEYAPNAQIYCVDRWDFNFIQQYQKSQYQDYELAIMRAHPLYETFLINTWDLQEREVDDEGNCAGIVPMRMDTVEALQYLHENGAYPDVIYIDGDHSTLQVKRELEAALLYFPEAIILGNDYRNPTVQGAVDGVAQVQTPEPLPVYTDSYSMIWILRSQLEEGNYIEVKLVEDAKSEEITKSYQKLTRMITSGCTRQELAYELVHTSRKSFVPYLNHCAKKNKGRTVLMHAAAEGHKSAVELLSDPNGTFHVNVNIQGHNNDYTALHYAAYNGHATCAQALLRAGALCTLVNKYDETPIQSAHSRGHSHIENGIQRWLATNPETAKNSGGVNSALKEHTKKGHGLSKSGGHGGGGGGGGDASDAGDGGATSNSSGSSSGKRRVEEMEQDEAKQNEEILDSSEPKQKRTRK